MEKKKVISIIVVVFFVIITGIFYIKQREMVSKDNLIEVTLEEEGKDTHIVSEESILLTKGENNSKICVHICGEVKKPGVYYLKLGMRVYDVIKVAGGCKKSADETAINQADTLIDGQQIYIPSKKEGVMVDKVEKKEDSSKVNINTATLEQLMTLSGIGEGKAKKILEYREKVGKFDTIEDIKKIAGIKDGVFQKIKDAICT